MAHDYILETLSYNPTPNLIVQHIVFLSLPRGPRGWDQNDDAFVLSLSLYSEAIYTKFD